MTAALATAPQAEEYSGQTQDNLPHGQGTYLWPDGSRYVGQWVAGKKEGRGLYEWPSGSRYDGDWVAGAMHGQGSFSSPDGTKYSGSWANDVKHGFGRKVFPNGDVYEGLFAGGQPGGPGVYKWASGNEFNGEWAAGRMTGRGTFVWAGGERYDGGWRDGKEDGSGTFTWPDGSYFKGTWEGGVKHGAGIWVPPPSEPGAPQQPREAVRRIYKRGELVNETSAGEELPEATPAAGPAAVKSRKKRDVKLGKTVFKGAPSYNLMLQLQLGIRWSVGRVTPLPARELRGEDYVKGSPLAATKAVFPRGGSPTTPPHESHDFKWKDYCPMVFRRLREKFGIDAGEYMLSLCGDMALRELSSPGKSGSMFFLSQDGAFIIKTMRKAEMTHLCANVLRSYVEHLDAYPEMMLTRFFGLHRVKPQGGRNVRFVVMGNLLNTQHVLHRRYDLKGSTQGRLTPSPFNPSFAILKDLDIEYTFQLEDTEAAKRLRTQLAADAALLARLNVMDYSLLLGVHFRTRPASGPGSARPAGGPPATAEEEEDEWGADFAGIANESLGMNMTALAVPGRCLAAPKGVVQLPLPKESQPVVLNFGIIDFLQEYNLTKHSENVWKSYVVGQQNISSVDSKSYADRFDRFISDIFHLGKQ